MCSSDLVMALADYGEPAYLDKLRQIVAVAPDGSFHLDPSYFGFSRGRRMYSRSFVKTFGPPREPGSEVEQRHRDLAASLQKLLEEILVASARHLYAETRLANLCIAGGVGLNCVANARMLEDTPFERVFVQPASGDSGAALGAACYAASGLLGLPRAGAMRDAYLGPEYLARAIRRVLQIGRAHV